MGPPTENALFSSFEAEWRMNGSTNASWPPDGGHGEIPESWN
jgi:hypothetical protein